MTAIPIPDTSIDVDALAQEIRRVDGNHKLGAGALAEALVPFISQGLHLASAAREPFGWLVVGQATTLFTRTTKRPDLTHINGFDGVATMIPLQPMPGAMEADVERLRLLERQALYESTLATTGAPQRPAPVESFAQLALEALRFYKESYSGQEPSVGVFERMVDKALAAAQSENGAPVAVTAPAA